SKCRDALGVGLTRGWAPSGSGPDAAQGCARPARRPRGWTGDTIPAPGGQGRRGAWLPLLPVGPPALPVHNQLSTVCGGGAAARNSGRALTASGCHGDAWRRVNTAPPPTATARPWTQALSREQEARGLAESPPRSTARWPAAGRVELLGLGVSGGPGRAGRPGGAAAVPARGSGCFLGRQVPRIPGGPRL
ncbi:hypothetical protein KIL84_017755, partial [Mauremys mutica]